jgi:hypothetical protein
MDQETVALGEPRMHHGKQNFRLNLAPIISAIMPWRSKPQCDLKRWARELVLQRNDYNDFDCQTALNAITGAKDKLLRGKAVTTFSLLAVQSSLISSFVSGP